MKSTEHNIKADNLGGGHNGEYDYRCTECGASDWIAIYGTEDQLNFYDTPCPGKKVVAQPSVQDYHSKLVDAICELTRLRLKLGMDPHAPIPRAGS